MDLISKIASNYPLPIDLFDHLYLQGTPPEKLPPVLSPSDLSTVIFTLAFLCAVRFGVSGKVVMRAPSTASPLLVG